MEVYSAGMQTRVLVIDNYDSFVYILVQYLGELGVEPLVYRNDTINVDEAFELNRDRILISPGPGTPQESGISLDLIHHFAGLRPIFGVCLGLQCIAQAFGARIIQSPQVMHGKTSSINHTGTGIFKGLESPIEATRYHSLIVERSTVPDCLELTGETSDGLVMGLRHRDFPVEGVQFHPESILTSNGYQMVERFLTST